MGKSTLWKEHLQWVFSILQLCVNLKNPAHMTSHLQPEHVFQQTCHCLGAITHPAAGAEGILHSETLLHVPSLSLLLALKCVFKAGHKRRNSSGSDKWERDFLHLHSFELEWKNDWKTVYVYE